MYCSIRQCYFLTSITEIITLIMSRTYTFVFFSILTLLFDYSTYFIEKKNVLQFIHSFSSLSYDRSKASPKASSPRSAT